MRVFPTTALHSIGFVFGQPYPPNFGSLSGHPHLGTDVLGVGRTPLPIGTPLVAVEDAVVERITHDNGILQGGNELFFRTTDGILHWYFHLSQFKCKVGDRVKSGQIIALSGGTGTATNAPHLHWGCGRQFSTNITKLINPLEWLKQGESNMTKPEANSIIVDLLYGVILERQPNPGEAEPHVNKLLDAINSGNVEGVKQVGQGFLPEIRQKYWSNPAILITKIKELLKNA